MVACLRYMFFLDFPVTSCGAPEDDGKMKNYSNPFAQPPRLWQASLIVPAGAAAMFEAVLSEMALSSSLFEAEETGEWWRVDLIFGEPPEEAALAAQVAALAKQQQIEMPAIEIAEVAQKNWLAEVAASHPPLRIGRYYVYGSHVEEVPPPGSVALKVEAGLAFGSGEHATTEGCLRMIGELGKKGGAAARQVFRSAPPPGASRHPRLPEHAPRHVQESASPRGVRVLDMGCGSGILAMAAAKTFAKARVVAADLDPVSVAVTKENAKINEVRLRAVVSDGYAAREIGRCGPYDLIVANILARPLVKFSKDLAAHLAPGGVAVLSGLLVRQENMVLAAHRVQGLRLRKRWQQGGWSVLVLES